MAVRIYIEIGHEASIRTKKTLDGFTHDWEVFVRGCEGAEIHHFIEKVVFYLHETFPKPKRVIKEPPYTIKESGYAGFILPIDIYLKNSGEPKKIKFNYDLHLQPSGPPIIKVQKEKYVFSNISEDFKIKLLKGGGTIASSSNISEITENRSNIEDKNQLISKPKLSGNDLIKKPKLKIDSYNSNFHEVFGPPIIASSKTDSKQSVWKDSKNSSKSEKDKGRSKFSPHKDSHKDKDKEKTKEKVDSEKKASKEEKKLKERSKDRERSRDKEKSQKKEKSLSPRRSPKRTPPRLSSPAISKHKEVKSYEKEKKDKSDEISKKPKKEKRSKEHKDDKRNDDIVKIDEYREKSRIEKDTSKKDVNKLSKTDSPPSPIPKVPEKKEKVKEKKEKDKDVSKEKYKSKKKDKEKREKKEEKLHKSEKKPEKSESKASAIKPELPPPSPKKEKNYLLDDDCSSSSISSSTSSVVIEKKSKIEIPKVKEEKNPKLKKEKGYQDGGIKCKRKSNTPDSEEPPGKMARERESSVNNNGSGDQDNHFSRDTTQAEEDYLSLLRELQQKIMGLKDNNDLTKVVQLIAETGRYEVSAHTFDFDLCLLDRATVHQLQEFFANET